MHVGIRRKEKIVVKQMNGKSRKKEGRKEAKKCKNGK